MAVGVYFCMFHPDTSHMCIFVPSSDQRRCDVVVYMYSSQITEPTWWVTHWKLITSWPWHSHQGALQSSPLPSKASITILPMSSQNWTDAESESNQCCQHWFDSDSTLVQNDIFKKWTLGKSGIMLGAPLQVVFACKLRPWSHKTHRELWIDTPALMAI